MLAGGTAGSQLLLVLAAPLLTRLYTPEDFGVLAVYASLLGLICVISSLRYELAIPLPENDEEAASVTVLCLLIVLGATVLTSLLVVLFGNTTAEFLGAAKLSPYLWLLPVGVFASSTYSIFNYWSLRNKSFPAIARTKLRQAFTTLVLQIGAFKLGAPALLAGQVFGHSAGTLSLALPAFKGPAFQNVSRHGIGRAARRYRRFPIFSTWEGLTNTASLQLAPMVFSAAFGPASLGLYALAHRVLTLPLGLVGYAIGQAFFAHAPDAHREGKMGTSVTHFTVTLARLGAPPLILLILFGPDLFALVFGTEWRHAGYIAAWMAPWLYLQFIYSPISTVFSVTESQGNAFAAQATLLFVRSAALFAGWISQSFDSAIVFFCAASAFGYLICLVWAMRNAGAANRCLLNAVFKSNAIATVCVFPMLVVHILSITTPVWCWTAWATTAFLCTGYFIAAVRSLQRSLPA